MHVWGIVAALACGITGSIGGQAQEGALTFHEYADLKEAEQFQMSAGYGYVAYTKLVGYTLPKGALEAVYLELVVGHKNAKYIAVAAKSDAQVQGHDLMWIDWNGDKKFDESEKANPIEEGVTRSNNVGSGARTFKPCSDPVVAGHALRLLIVCGPTFTITVLPAGYMEATITLNGKAVKVGIIDTDANGVYGDTYGIGRTGDQLLFDRDGNRKFYDNPNIREVDPFKTEVLPFHAMMPTLGEGLCEVTVTDGSTIAIKNYEGELGEVVFEGAKGEYLDAEGPRGSLFIDSKEGKFLLPAGPHRIGFQVYKLTDSKGRTWKFYVEKLSGKAVPIAADKPFIIKCDAPITIEVSQSTKGRTHVFTISYVRADGSPIGCIEDAKSGEAAGAMLTIMDPKGKTLMSAPFKTNRDLVLSASWTPAKSMKEGTYTAVVTWNAGARPAGVTKAKVKVTG